MVCSGQEQRECEALSQERKKGARILCILRCAYVVIAKATDKAKRVVAGRLTIKNKTYRYETKISNTMLRRTQLFEMRVG